MVQRWFLLPERVGQVRPGSEMNGKTRRMRSGQRVNGQVAADSSQCGLRRSLRVRGCGRRKRPRRAASSGDDDAGRDEAELRFEAEIRALPHRRADPCSKFTTHKLARPLPSFTLHSAPTQYYWPALGTSHGPVTHSEGAFGSTHDCAMHSVIRPNTHVALRLPTGLFKIVEITPNTYVA
jgi:hypothetical protein